MSDAAKARRRKQIAKGQLKADNGLAYRPRIVRQVKRQSDKGERDGVFERPAGERVWRPKR